MESVGLTTTGVLSLEFKTKVEVEMVVLVGFFSSTVHNEPKRGKNSNFKCGMFLAGCAMHDYLKD